MRIFQDSTTYVEDQRRFRASLWLILGWGALLVSLAIALWLIFVLFVPRVGIIAHRAATSAHFVTAPRGQYTYSYTVEGRQYSSPPSNWGGDATDDAAIQILYDRERPWNSVPDEPVQLNLGFLAMSYAIFILFPAAAGTAMVVLARQALQEIRNSLP